MTNEQTLEIKNIYRSQLQHHPQSTHTYTYIAMLLKTWSNIYNLAKEDEVLLAAINEIIKPYTDIENFNESLPRKAKAASDG